MRCGRPRIDDVCPNLVANYRPLNTLTFARRSAGRSETQRWSGAKIQTPTASVSLLYKPESSVCWSVRQADTRARSRSDGLIGTEIVQGRGMFAFNLNPIYGHPTTLSWRRPTPIQRIGRSPELIPKIFGFGPDSRRGALSRCSSCVPGPVAESPCSQMVDGRGLRNSFSRGHAHESSPDCR